MSTPDQVEAHEKAHPLLGRFGIRPGGFWLVKQTVLGRPEIHLTIMEREHAEAFVGREDLALFRPTDSEGTPVPWPEKTDFDQPDQDESRFNWALASTMTGTSEVDLRTQASEYRSPTNEEGDK